MTTISTADLTSELVDLTAVRLGDLIRISTRQLADAVAWEIASATTNTEERQVQQQ